MKYLTKQRHSTMNNLTKCHLMKCPLTFNTFSDFHSIDAMTLGLCKKSTSLADKTTGTTIMAEMPMVRMMILIARFSVLNRMQRVENSFSAAYQAIRKVEFVLGRGGSTTAKWRLRLVLAQVVGCCVCGLPNGSS